MTERKASRSRAPYLLAMLAFAAVGAAGCGDVQIQAGRAPGASSAAQSVFRSTYRSVLEQQLEPGKSTRADVAAVLGEPGGKGRVMLPTDAAPRTMWTYYYQEGDLKDDRGSFLFIFFEGDTYDGYMEFSSLH